MITRQRLADKLSPRKVSVSGKFTAMLAYFLDQRGWTEPEIKAMWITSDGFLLVANNIGPMPRAWGLADAFEEGTVDDLDRNLRGVAATVGLSEDETNALLRFARERITDHRQRLDA